MFENDVISNKLNQKYVTKPHNYDSVKPYGAIYISDIVYSFDYWDAVALLDK